MASSDATTWKRLPCGRTSRTSNVPVRISSPNPSRWPTSMSVRAKLMPATPYRSETSGRVQPPSTGRWLNRTRIATKSVSALTNVPTKSSANESRYWARDRMDAAARCAYVSRAASGSATLDHQAADAGGQHEPAEAEQGERPGELEQERAGQVEAAVLAEEHVDRQLEHRGEREHLDHGPDAAGQEGKGDDRPGEERPDQRRHAQDAAVVEEPERAEVDQEAGREADDRGQRDGDGEGEPEQGVGRQVEAEQELGEQDRGEAAEDRVVGGAAEIGGEPRPLQVHGAAQVDHDVAADDPEGEIVPAPEVRDHEEALDEPDVGERVGGVVAADTGPAGHDGQEDVASHEAEDAVGERARECGATVGRVAPVPADRQLPVGPHGSPLWRSGRQP